ncbi:MAG: glycosyltransferase family 4 protein [Patescibacteria group bacterium]|nr:glycosyltransferase family 4 protein [Patescibacteria group bacterium]
MKILMLNYEYPPLGGGAATACQSLLKEFAKRPDLEIDLITSSPDSYYEETLNGNITVYHLDINKNSKNGHYQKHKDLLRYAANSFSFAKKLKKDKNYDLTHAWFGIPAGFVAMFLGKPYIVALRGMDVPGFSNRFQNLNNYVFPHLDQIIWGKASAVTANSEGLKKLALKTKPKQEIKVIYNGIDTKTFAPAQKKKDNSIFKILSTSRLTSRKGISYLIKGFAKFHKKVPESELILVGSGNKKSELFIMAKERGLNSSIKFSGSVPHEDIPEKYQRADVFVLPSLNEGMSNSLLEAMACQLPVIATDTGGTAELVDTSNGIIVKKKSSKDIANALSTLYDNKEKLEEMGRESKKKAEKLSWEKITNDYYQLYQQIMNK